MATIAGRSASRASRIRRGSSADIGAQKIASGFTGEPVALASRSGAIASMNSHRLRAAHARGADRPAPRAAPVVQQLDGLALRPPARGEGVAGPPFVVLALQEEGGGRAPGRDRVAVEDHPDDLGGPPPLERARGRARV